MRKGEANSNQLLIAALGASAGGLEALEKFFKHMPADSGIGFVIVQHLVPDRTSALPELLARCTDMAVEQAHDTVEVAPDRVYIIPPGATLTIENGRLRVEAPVEPRGQVWARIDNPLYDSWVKRPRREGMPDLCAISRKASFAKSSVTVGGLLASAMLPDYGWTTSGV